MIEFPYWKGEGYAIKVNNEWIFQISQDDMDRIVSLSKALDRNEKIDEIIRLKKLDFDSDTKSLEMEIDQLIYKLYNLTEEEIGQLSG